MQKWSKSGYKRRSGKFMKGNDVMDEKKVKPPRPLLDQIEEVISAFDTDRQRAGGVMALLQGAGNYMFSSSAAETWLDDDDDDDDQEKRAPPLRDEIAQIIASEEHQRSIEKGRDLMGGETLGVTAADLKAYNIIERLKDRGHICPGAPPASVILTDAQQFAERLTLSNLATRLIRMTIMTGVMTPESSGSERWLRDYLDGRNHGPVGKPMLWPDNLPGIAGMLRDWGFAPTAAKPAYVTRIPGGGVAKVQNGSPVLH